jgi:polyhydroxyalkanoate synthase
LPATPAQWRAATVRHAGSWWEDWAAWAAEHAGEMVDPPPMGSDNHPVLGDGPGDYIRT